MPAKTATSPKIAKNWKNRSFGYNEVSQVLEQVEGCQQKLRFLQKLQKIGEIAGFAKMN